MTFMVIDEMATLFRDAPVSVNHKGVARDLIAKIAAVSRSQGQGLNIVSRCPVRYLPVRSPESAR